MRSVRSRRRLTGAVVAAPVLALAASGPAIADVDADAIAEDLQGDCVAIVVPAEMTESDAVWDELLEDLRDEVDDVRGDELDLKVVLAVESPDPAQSIADQVLATAGGTVLVITPDEQAAASDELPPERVQEALAGIDREIDDEAEFDEEVAEEQDEVSDEVDGPVEDALALARVDVLAGDAEGTVEQVADELDSGFSWGLVGVQVVGVSLLAGAATAVVVRRRNT